MLFGKHINKFYVKYAFSFILGFISLIAVDYAQLKVPEYLGLAMDNMKNGVPYQDYLFEVVTNILIVAFIMFAGRLIWRVALFGVAIKVQTDLRKEIFKKTTSLSRDYYSENKVGELMSLMTYDLEAIQDVMGFGMVSLVDCVFLGGLTIYKMFSLDWRLSLLSMIPLLIIALLSGTIEKGMSLRYEKRQKNLDNLSDFAQENFSGIRVIKAFVQESFEHMEARRLGKKCKDSDISLTRFSAGVETIITFLTSTVIVLIIGVGGYLVYQSSLGQLDMPLSVGEITTFIGYFDTLIWPMMALGNIIVMISKGKTSLKRVSKVLDLKEDIKDGSKSLNKDIKGKIEFRNLTFKYKNAENDCLKNITLTINPGEKIGVVGRIGSGKTTLMDILLRLYNVAPNTVFIDDQDIMNLPVKEVRNIIGYVPQDSFLFSDSVKNNITFSNANLSDEKVIKASEFSCVKDNIENFENGFDTEIGERGVTLSGGQKQRIAISRAYIKDSPILILDDSVSAVDMKTEKEILNNIYNLRANKTTILIASRVSTVEHLDKILVLNGGKVEAFDTHKNLIKISPLYHHMVQIQKFEEQMGGTNERE